MPDCSNCSQNSPSITGYPTSNCSSGNNCGTDASCVIYTGPALTCIGINPKDSLARILQKLDPLICAAGGDYSQFNTYCLSNVSTQQDFVEGISQAFCDLKTAYTTFTGTTFPAAIAGINSSLAILNSPGIVCSSANVLSNDNLNTVLTKYCSKFAAIDAAMNPSSANWNQCYSVSVLPTTVIGGFNTLIAQICLLKASIASGSGGGTLPVFNNVGSCLPAPLTTADTLVDTIAKIKTRLCQTGTLDISSLSWGCTTAPTTGNNTDLQATIQAILTKLNANSLNSITTWSSDFSVTLTDSANPCAGKTIQLAGSVAPDRKVAASSTDATPGTLQEKITPGTNISLDFTTTPGQMIINAAGGGSGGGEVLADSLDTTPDYLINKIVTGSTNAGVTIVPSLSTAGGNHQVAMSASVDPVVLFTALLNAAATNPTLKNLFCSFMQSCPSPCAAVTNVSVIYTAGTTTSTSTTTTP